MKGNQSWQTKKSNSKAPAKEQKRSTPNISARIDRLVDYAKSKVKAIASVKIGGAFAIHGHACHRFAERAVACRCRRTLSRRTARPSIGHFNPITADARTELNSKVLEDYEQKLERLS
jgi:DNA-binding cell septation regulator SpoVG